ncbi:MAG: DUF1420 family protein, partial [Candidatus Acidiferrales bacterium]
MALISAAGSLAVLLVLFFISAAFGSRALRFLGLETDRPLDHLLFASGAGFATLQLLAGILSLAAGLQSRSAIVLLAAMAAAAGSGWKSLFRLGRDSFKDLAKIFEPATAKGLGIGILFFAGVEALLATAPLTGSDAMHYHFTAPLLQLGKPEQPIFWLTHAFLAGLGHELIGLGLALGGDRLALLLIYLSGCLTAAALLQFARRLMPVEWALSAVLTFFMAPMVFWQISTAGSPDIWMGFYVLLATLATAEIAGSFSAGLHVKPGPVPAGLQVKPGPVPAGLRVKPGPVPAGLPLKTADTSWIVLAGVYAGAAGGIKST